VEANESRYIARRMPLRVADAVNSIIRI
jgi:hypothetical protein